MKIRCGRRECAKYAPGSLVYDVGNTNHMVANSEVVITQYSSVVYVGIALGKEVHSLFRFRLSASALPHPKWRDFCVPYCQRVPKLPIKSVSLS
jgi:hypothetical protein